MGNLSPQPDDLRRPHPLAQALIERLGSGSNARILELGSGRGRNTAALRAAGFEVQAIADGALRAPLETGREHFDAALSTHGLLHGTPSIIAALVSAAAQALKPSAPFYATFASKRDARFGSGERVDENTYAPLSGDEAGVPHVYYDGAALRRLLEPAFSIETLEEVDAGAIVGRWAHAQAPAGTVHWFLRARKREFSSAE